MKFEPFGALLFGMSIASIGAGGVGWDLVGMSLGGASLAGVYSVIKGRKQHAEPRDIALYAYFAATGGALCGLALAPELAGKTFDLPWLGKFTMFGAPSLALLISIGAAPLIDKLARGWILDLLPEKFGGRKKGED